MSLQTIFDDLLALLTSAGVTAPMHLGARHLVELAAPPRIVWVPTTDTIGAPKNLGMNPRHLFTSDLGIAVHCWGESFDAALELRDAFVRAARRYAHALFTISGGGFYNPAEDAWIKLGEVYVLQCSFPLPITDSPASAVATPETLEAAGEALP